MSTYSVIIVDDEIPQQKILSGMLDGNKHYSIKKIFSTINDAAANLKQFNPDLVFLDVVMPPKTGFDLLNELGEIDFEIIFTTSFEEFALRAFKFSAVDYLLKPFDKNDLSSALEKFESKSKLKQSFTHIQTLLKNLRSGINKDNKIALPVMNGYTFVKVEDIIRCEANDMYTTFHLTDKSKITVSKTLKECEALLTDYGFFRCHLSHMINMNFILQYIKGDGGQLKMSDESIIDVSRRKKDEFIRLFNKI